ncbi:MAG: DUF2069 domain-containing protein [Gammaproteobacteria bacterium]|nr:DUF2069 domain-containing protein [Gammaproteobacteria bacterium]
MRVTTLRRICWLSLLALAAVLIAWPTQSLARGGVWLGLLLATPLLLPAWGIARNRRRPLQGGILIQSLYLVVGLTEFVANQAARPWALAVLLTSLAVCAALLTLLRIPGD